MLVFMRYLVWGVALLSAAVLLLEACASSRQAQESDAGVRVWRRDTPWGEVTVRQMRGDNELCIWREVTLRREVGLYIDRRPSFVRVTDYLCDDAFDEWHFRSTIEQQRADYEDLSVLLLHLMYSVLPIEEHWRQ